MTICVDGRHSEGEQLLGYQAAAVVDTLVAEGGALWPVSR